MAVRRISDLPNLSSYYPDAELSDAMIEVSYAPPNTSFQRRYQSFHAWMTEIMNFVVNKLRLADKNKPGIVQIGDNINVNNMGIISVPVASKSSLGVVQIGEGINVNSSGVISVTAGYTPSDATTSSKGIVQIGSNISVNSGIISVPDASATAKGVVKVTTGNGLAVTDGVLSMGKVVPDITIDPGITEGTLIATITVNGTPTKLYQSNDSSDGSVYSSHIPVYDSAIEVEIPKSKWRTTSSAINRPSVRIKMPFDAFITYDSEIGLTINDSYVLDSPFNADQYGYWATAGQYIYLKGKDGGKKKLTIYPLANANIDDSTASSYIEMCNHVNMDEFYDGVNLYSTTVFDECEFQGHKQGSSTWDSVLDPASSYNQIRLIAKPKNGWYVLVNCMRLTLKTWLFSSGIERTCQIGYAAGGAKLSEIGKHSMKAVAVKLDPEIVCNGNNQWYKYKDGDWIEISADPKWWDN